MLMRRSKSAATRLAAALALLRRPLSNGQCASLALPILFFAYVLIFTLAGDSPRAAARDSSINVLALLIVAAPAWLANVALRRVGGLAELALHGILALLFSFLWFFVLMVLIGLGSSRGWSDFDVRPIFDFRASAWQLAQGVTLYAALASMQAARLENAPRDAPHGRDHEQSPRVSRYFVRKDGDALPVDLERVILVRGADDYSEIVTLAGTHLVRMTLEQFQQRLDPAQFCRIHRSLIVNLGHVERFERDGSGRMLLWMDNGERLRSSRAGASLLRSMII